MPDVPNRTASTVPRSASRNGVAGSNGANVLVVPTTRVRSGRPNAEIWSSSPIADPLWAMNAADATTGTRGSPSVEPPGRANRRNTVGGPDTLPKIGIVPPADSRLGWSRAGVNGWTLPPSIRSQRQPAAAPFSVSGDQPASPVEVSVTSTVAISTDPSIATSCGGASDTSSPSSARGDAGRRPGAAASARSKRRRWSVPSSDPPWSGIRRSRPSPSRSTSATVRPSVPGSRGAPGSDSLPSVRNPASTTTASLAGIPGSAMAVVGVTAAASGASSVAAGVRAEPGAGGVATAATAAGSSPTSVPFRIV